jgi:hypothetical protein
MSKLSDYDNYSGDINLEYGGYFYNLDNWEDDYVEVLRVTDLDSGAGVTSTVMIEHLVALIPSDVDKINEVLSVIGTSLEEMPDRDSLEYKLILLDAILAYGYYDMDSGWDNYRSHHTVILQTDYDENNEDNPDLSVWDGDIARIADDNILKWLEYSGHMVDF